MLIKDFYLAFTSEHERSCLFDVLRRLSRLDKLLLSEEVFGWPEWPPPDPGGPGHRVRPA